MPQLVLEHFSIEVVSTSRGRANIIWLVNQSNEEKVLRCWHTSNEYEIEFERWFASEANAKGWPAPVPSIPILANERYWSIEELRAGSALGSTAENYLQLGRLMGEFHEMTNGISPVRQRPSWRVPLEEIYASEDIRNSLDSYEPERREEVEIVRKHLDLGREWLNDRFPSWNRTVLAKVSPVIPIHGDFAPWNLLFGDGKLTGLLDFELSRVDYRVADFIFSWRGAHDEVIAGYCEVIPMSQEERDLIVPCRWAYLIDQFLAESKQGLGSDLTLQHLSRRSCFTEM